MNLKIKELAEQANKQFRQQYDAARRADETLDTTYEQVFAEKIIQEAIQVCLVQRDPPNLNYKPSERFAEAIKQHFGVN